MVASYQRNISQDTYQATLGLSIAFDTLLGVSSYRKPTKIIPHLSELHAFESIVLDSNIQLQSSKGVQKQETVESEEDDGTTPDQFTFVDIVYTDETFPHSNTITVSGLADGATTTITIVDRTDSRGGYYLKVKGRRMFLYQDSTPRTVENGDEVTAAVYLDNPGDSDFITISIGGVTDTFTAQQLH